MNTLILLSAIIYPRAVSAISNLYRLSKNSEETTLYNYKLNYFLDPTLNLTCENTIFVKRGTELNRLIVGSYRRSKNIENLDSKLPLDCGSILPNSFVVNLNKDGLIEKIQINPKDSQNMVTIQKFLNLFIFNSTAMEFLFEKAAEEAKESDFEVIHKYVSMIDENVPLGKMCEVVQHHTHEFSSFFYRIAIDVEADDCVDAAVSGVMGAQEFFSRIVFHDDNELRFAEAMQQVKGVDPHTGQGFMIEAELQFRNITLDAIEINVDYVDVAWTFEDFVKQVQFLGGEYKLLKSLMTIPIGSQMVNEIKLE